MYIPAHFATGDRRLLVELMRRHAFATLVTVSGDGAPVANHLPFVVDEEPLTIRGHMARANPQWRAFDREVLVVFQGPHGYVSPSSYVHDSPEARVPTWNYAAVHAYGRPRIMDDGETARLVEQLVEIYEAPRDAPWTVDMTTPARRALLKAIVGFTIEVVRVDGKLKLSQNRAPEDRRRVEAAFAASGAPGEQELAALMARGR